MSLKPFHKGGHFLLLAAYSSCFQMITVEDNVETTYELVDKLKQIL